MDPLGKQNKKKDAPPSVNHTERGAFYVYYPLLADRGLYWSFYWDSNRNEKGYWV
jgi:hypothetical protein